MDKEKRTECGKIGRDWVCSDESMMSGTWMSKNFIDHMETAFKKWTPKSKFSIYKV